MQHHGTVRTGRNNIFDVALAGSVGPTAPAGADRSVVYTCRIKGKTLRLEERAYNPLAPGDEVVLSDLDTLHETAVIRERLPRTSAFQRYNRKREALQTLAANVDLVVAVASAAQPAFRDRFVDRVLALAAYHDLPAALIVTKADLDAGLAGREADRYAAVGYETLVAAADDEAGLAAIVDVLRGRRSVFVGQSGVGKSTLLNRLAGTELQRTGEVSARYLRGRHTTTASVLLRAGGLEIVDTPGIRELDCRHVPLDTLDRFYPEFAPWLGTCALSDCRHAEEPGCAVRSAADAGALDTRRYESYLRLFGEISDLQEGEP